MYAPIIQIFKINYPQLEVTLSQIEGHEDCCQNSTVSAFDLNSIKQIFYQLLGSAAPATVNGVLFPYDSALFFVQFINPLMTSTSLEEMHNIVSNPTKLHNKISGSTIMLSDMIRHYNVSADIHTFILNSINPRAKIPTILLLGLTDKDYLTLRISYQDKLNIPEIEDEVAGEIIPMICSDIEGYF